MNSKELNKRMDDFLCADTVSYMQTSGGTSREALALLREYRARIAELEAELASLKRIVNQWDKACDIAESHLQGYVNVGDSLFNGIPKMAAERDELRSALAASKEREGEAVMLLGRVKPFIVLARARSSWDSEKSAADDLCIDVDEFITSLKEKRDE